MDVASETVRAVTSNPRVLRFLGGQHELVPLTQKEIDRVISQIKGEISVASEKSDFTIGAEADISEGPFAGFVGIIDKVDKEIIFKNFFSLNSLQTGPKTRVPIGNINLFNKTIYVLLNFK